MTYSELKDIPWTNLIDLLIRTFRAFRDLPDYADRLPTLAGAVAPNPPVLCIVGDFEIRARFHDDDCQPIPTGSDPEDLQCIDALKVRCQRQEEEIAALKEALSHYKNHPPTHPPAADIPQLADYSGGLNTARVYFPIKVITDQARSRLEACVLAAVNRALYEFERAEHIVDRGISVSLPNGESPMTFHAK